MAITPMERRRFVDGRFVEYDPRRGLVRDVAKIAGEEDRYNPGKLRFWVGNSEEVDPARITALLNSKEFLLRR